jgi:hypothetical protein
MICVICHKDIEADKNDDGEIIWDQGNSAEPIDEGRCCNKCNETIVTPARLTEIMLGEK